MNVHPAHSNALLPAVARTDDAAVALAAARSLLRIRSRAEAARILHDAVLSLGGVLVPARESSGDALPLDVSLGVGEVLLVMPATGHASALDRLARSLPMLVQDAIVAAEHCDGFDQEALRASVDELTGVANRREIYSRLRNAHLGDVVGLVDMDDFKALNDTRGHAAGDEALRLFGLKLRAWFRDDDFVGRYGGDEFILVLKASRLSVARERLQAFAESWTLENEQLPTLSAGVARVDEHGGPAALRTADRALYRAKHRGRNFIECATPADAGPDKDPS